MLAFWHSVSLGLFVTAHTLMKYSFDIETKSLLLPFSGRWPLGVSADEEGIFINDVTLLWERGALNCARLDEGGNVFFIKMATFKNSPNPFRWETIFLHYCHQTNQELFPTRFHKLLRWIVSNAAEQCCWGFFAKKVKVEDRLDFWEKKVSIKNDLLQQQCLTTDDDD